MRQRTRLVATAVDGLEIADQRVAAPAFERVRQAARQTLYSGDCYAYGMIASGWSDVHVDAKMEMYDYLAAVPVIEGAGGVMSDWEGKPLTLESGDRVIAVGDRRMHGPVMALLNG